MQYTDANIPISCGECDKVEEGIPAMLAHVLELHPHISREETDQSVRSWADSAYESNDAHDAWRSSEYRRTGVDPDREE